MNPDTKEFVPLPEQGAEPASPMASWPVFKVGEEHEINGVVFRIRKITKKDIVLRPVRDR